MTPTPPPTADLIACLVRYASLTGRPVSQASITAGLPLHDADAAETALQQAAARAGLTLSRVAAADARSAVVSGDGLIVRSLQGHALMTATRDGVRLHTPEGGDAGGTRELDHQQTFERLLAAEAAWHVRPVAPVHAPDADLPADTDRYAWLRRAVLARWRTYLWVGVASLVANVLVVLSSFYSMQIYDRVIPNDAFATLWTLSVGVTLVYLFDLVMRVLRAYMIDHAGKQLDQDISSRLFEQVVGTRLSHRPASAGVFANQLNDFESIRDFFTSLTLTTVIDFPFVLVYLVAIAIMGGHLVWVPLLVMPLMLLTAWGLQGPVDRSVRASMQASARKHGMLIEVIAGVETVKLTASEGVFQGAWERAVRSIAQASMRSRLISTTGLSVVNLLQSLASVGLMIVGVHLISGQALTMGGLIAASILTSRALAPCSQLASLLSRWKQTRISMDTLARIFEAPVERPAGKSFLVRDAMTGAIELRAVDFTHTHSAAPALTGVSLSIGAGERVAVIGRSGSGKSTLGKLVTGLLEPGRGTVLVGGIDVRQLDPQQLRRAIGSVPQDPFLFNGTLRENIACGAESLDDDALLRAAEVAGVDAFARTHPLGYDMPVGERGARLSGGQRQAVVLARALAMPRSVLLLDEPSSSLDHVAERFLRERLALRPPGETLLLITHRLGLLDLVDRVIVLHEGRVALDGPRDAVLRQLRGEASAPAGAARPGAPTGSPTGPGTA